jgi:hypothetical protein
MAYLVLDIIRDTSSIISARSDNLLIYQGIVLDPKQFWLPEAGHIDGLSDGSF